MLKANLQRERETVVGVYSQDMLNSVSNNTIFIADNDTFPNVLQIVEKLERFSDRILWELHAIIGMSLTNIILGIRSPGTETTC